MMRKLWVKAWITLDGVFDAGTMGLWWPPANETPEDFTKRIDYIAEEYSQGDTYLLGRTTYEMLYPGWSQDTTSKLGSLLHNMKKFVVSNTLTSAPWEGSSIISGDMIAEITKLKQQSGNDIIIDGSATLVQSLMGTGLIDEYRFLVQPFIMGKGKRFFPEGMPPTTIKLVESQVLSFGSMALVFQPTD